MCVIIYVVHFFLCTICVQLVFDYVLSDYGPMIYIYISIHMVLWLNICYPAQWYLG